MSVVTPELVHEVCHQFTQVGMAIRIVSIDNRNDSLELDLEFHDVDCLDCVLPKDHLERLIASNLSRRAHRDVQVVLHDPRSLPRESEAGAHRGVQAEMIEVLDPTASGSEGNPDPGPDVGELSGKTILFRVDPLWRSWDWTVDQWTPLLEAAGARVLNWRRWQGIPGEEGQRLQADYEEQVANADVLVSGLANCGSCSAWTIRDALTGLNRGLPTAAVATEQFLPLAKLLALDGNRPGLRIVPLPYPLNTLPEEEVRSIAREAFPSLMSILGVTVLSASC